MVKTKLDMGKPLNPWFVNPVKYVLLGYDAHYFFLSVREGSFYQWEQQDERKKILKRNCRERIGIYWDSGYLNSHQSLNIKDI